MLRLRGVSFLISFSVCMSADKMAVFAANIATKYQDVANAVWRDFVPQALQSGQLKPKLDPIIIEGGLEKVQAGLDRQKQGVSAAKVVIPVA